MLIIKVSKIKLITIGINKFENIELIDFLVFRNIFAFEDSQ